MPNGAFASLPREIEPAAPGDGESELEAAVAEALADAVVAVICAVAEFRDEGLRPNTKACGGVMIGRLYKLQVAIGEREFSRLVWRRGRQECRALGISDRLIDVAIDWLVEDVLVKVGAAVRACN